ncbi:MAG: hypothetical protein K2X87_09225 [Gemmataceae bacterium]|nr:hypothetical protein [Gemmataceae bacterium]
MYDFGLTSDQFWDLTLAQFNALSRRFDAEAAAADFHTARLMWAAMTAAGAKKKDGSALHVEDFITLKADDGPADDGRDPSEQIFSALANGFGLPAHMEWTRRV